MVLLDTQNALLGALQYKRMITGTIAELMERVTFEDTKLNKTQFSLLIALLEQTGHASVVGIERTGKKGRPGKIYQIQNNINLRIYGN